MPDSLGDLELATEIPEPPDDFRPTTAHLKYECTSCGRNVGRDNLKVKRTQFKEMGSNGPIIQTRTVAWLCVIPQEDGSPSCLERDPAWGLPRHSSAPGLANTRLADSRG